MRVLGLISGTSHDSIDAACVDFDYDGATLRAHLVESAAFPYPGPLREQLIAALPPNPTSLAEICQLDTLIGQAFAQAAAEVVANSGAADLICSHGQTVFHWVEAGQALGSLQIGQPAWIAERLATPVVADIRLRDITAGGQGAPLASLIDYLLLGGGDEVAVALNLGGIANITVVRPGGVVAYDTGPANALIDAAIREYGLSQAGYDAEGRIARQGQVVGELLDLFLAEPYYRQPSPKTTGKELYHWPYIQAHLAGLQHPVNPADLVATLTELTAQTVADQVRAQAGRRLLASGGGTHNPVLMESLIRLLPGVEVTTTDTIGLPADAKEAILMALIGWYTWHGLPAIIPGATGAHQARILGSITPGAGPLQLGEAVAPPRRLVLE